MPHRVWGFGGCRGAGHRSPGIRICVQYGFLAGPLHGRPAAVVNDRRAVLRLVLVRFFSALLGSVSVLFRHRLPRCGFAADKPAAFCRPCECPQHRGTRPLASRQTRTCGRRCMGFGNRSKIVVGVRGGRLFPSCPAARPPRRKAGNKARYGGLRVCASSAGVVSGGYLRLRHARSRSAFRKGNGTLPAVLLPK